MRLSMGAAVVAAFAFGVAFKTAVDLTGFVLVTSAEAKIAGMSYSELIRDSDFVGAVEDIIEDCEIEDNEIDC